MHAHLSAALTVAPWPLQIEGANMTSRAIHVGDKVRFRFGPNRFVGHVREDRGLIGIGARHLCLVLYDLGGENPYAIELPADQIEITEPKKPSG
jgi:hypothetical protein